LPGKRGLVNLRFEDCEIDASLICRLAAGLTKSWTTASAGPVLEVLELPGVQLDQEGLRAIVGLVTHRGSPLVELAIDLSGMGPGACELVGGCLPHTTNLRSLALRADECPGDAMGRLVDASSSLTSVSVSTTWTPDAVQSIAKQLKTNRKLESIHVFGEANGLVGEAFLAPLEDALRELNHSLQHVRVSFMWDFDTARIDGYLLRNRRIQRVLERLPPVFDPSLPLIVWPVALETASDLPALTYTLRQGDLHAFAEIVQGGTNDGGSDESPQRRDRRDRIGRRTREGGCPPLAHTPYGSVCFPTHLVNVFAR
jgi:hypothetical protein